MIYHIFEHFQYLDFPGSGIMQYISVRSILASITAIVLILCFGKKFIKYMQRKQLGEEIRDLGLEGQLAKKGTPTMGGVLILGAILVAVLLFGDLTNMYIQLLLITLVWLGCLGFADDYIKVFRKNKEGMPGKYKIVGQVILGLAVGITICVHEDTISTLTTIPFVKNNEFDYAWLTIGSGKTKELLQVIIYILVIIFIITAVSNGTNLTDGMDGLAAGITAIVGAVLGILAYFSGNVIYADYLNIMYIPESGEIVVYMSALIGALLGFLWYNSYPAQVFMGDTGSLALGGIIGVVAVLIRKELLSVLLPYVPQRARVSCHKSAYQCNFPNLRIQADGRWSFRILNKNISLKNTRIGGRLFTTQAELSKHVFNLGSFEIVSLDPATKKPLGKFKFK